MIRTALTVAGWGMMVAAGAHAQTGVGMLTGPWDPGQRAEADGDAWNVEAGDDTVFVTRHRVRVRLEETDLEPGPASVGAEYTQIHLSSANPRVPTRLIRGEAALGLPLGEVTLFGKPWAAGGTVGGGFASSAPLSDGRGAFGLATLFAQRDDWGGRLRLGVTYDGNRSILPDTPLPVFSYERGRVNGHAGAGDGSDLGVTIGYPTSRVTWRPNAKLTLSAGLDRLDAVSADARYELTDRVALTAAYGGFYDQFHVEDDVSRRRVFFVSQRFEAGAQVSGALGQLGLSGGYAVGQELREGYDLRDTRVIAEFDDGPFVRLAWRVGF